MDRIAELEADNEKLNKENLALHRQLAATKLSEELGWQRYEGANNSMKHTWSQLETAVRRNLELEQEVEVLRNKVSA